MPKHMMFVFALVILVAGIAVGQLTTAKAIPPAPLPAPQVSLNVVLPACTTAERFRQDLYATVTHFSPRIALPPLCRAA